MSPNEQRLRAELAVSEENLSERTRERDEAELAVLAGEHELVDIQSAFVVVTNNLSNLTSRLSHRTNQLGRSNDELVKLTEELRTSNDALTELKHEKDCFVAALGDLRKPIVGSTRILEYIASGKAPPERQPELLRQLMDFHKNLLSETDRLTAAFADLSARTGQHLASNLQLVEQTEELAGANTELQVLKALMQQREDFVAALAHDLKNPLTGATVILEYIADGSITTEELPEILRQVIDSNKSMLQLIWNMLDVYKSDSGCLEPKNENVDVIALTRQCLGDFGFAIKRKKLELLIQTPVAIPEVTTDKCLLRRVLMNLLDNAVKFSPPGGKLIVSASLREGHVILSIKDSGEGMSPDQLERVFDRFWQSAHGRQFGVGTGLGMFLTKQIMDLLGGNVECISEETIGTEFVITLNSDTGPQRSNLHNTEL